MGLISGLLLFPITGPVHGLEFVLEQLRRQAEAELLDEGRVRAEILNLNLLREMGELTDEEYAAQEAALLEHLRFIRAYREGLTVPIDEPLDQRIEDGDGEIIDAEGEVR